MTYAAWREQLGAANDPEFYPLAYQDRLINSGEGQFWDCGTAALVTLIKSYPGGAKALETYAVAGDSKAVVDVLKPAVEAWAADNGCTHIMITAGRAGWLRKFPGYRHQQTILVKEIP